jgi:hypothetical protein
MTRRTNSPSDGGRSDLRRTLPKEKRPIVALLILLAIVFITCASILFLSRFGPFEGHVEYKRNGVEVVMLGAAALFLVLFHMFFRAFLKIAAMFVVPLVIVGLSFSVFEQMSQSLIAPARFPRNPDTRALENNNPASRETEGGIDTDNYTNHRTTNPNAITHPSNK